ncbi:MAG: riboflavin synthase subunit alpha [Cyclobacteriaceae bacterium]|nr:MAG: riboflavin synthase subunit alpha [Cyclobacteriaceae bacterium]
MFTGIIESVGVLEETRLDGNNRVLIINSAIAADLKVDQSLSHNGVCLTVTSLIGADRYQVVAVPETLQRTNLGALSLGDLINLERSMVLGGRLDGHLVQGHVDQTVTCESIREVNGSWEFVFEFGGKHPIIEKGSVCLNGVSLTCYNLTENTFQVSVIPYTYENTNFKSIKPGNLVNLEFDMIGKYLAAILNLRS